MEGWEEQIDNDDHDLHSFLRPQILPFSSSLQPCSQIPSSSQTLNNLSSIPPSKSHIPNKIQEEEEEEEENLPKSSTSRPLIPGPAGALQIAMRRQSASAASGSSFLEERGRDDLDLCVGEQDEDFELNPWLYSLSLLGVWRQIIIHFFFIREICIPETLIFQKDETVTSPPTPAILVASIRERSAWIWSPVGLRLRDRRRVESLRRVRLPFVIMLKSEKML